VGCNYLLFVLAVSTAHRFSNYPTVRPRFSLTVSRNSTDERNCLWPIPNDCFQITAV